MIGNLGDMVAVVRAANLNDKSEVYQQMGLRLTYQPGQKVVQGRSIWIPRDIGFSMMVSEGGLATYVHGPDRPDY